MKRSGPVKRTKPPRKRNEARIRKRRNDAFEGAGGKAEYVRSLPCVVCRIGGLKQTTRTEAAHLKSRGAGGKADALIPLCQSHHFLQHTIGVRTLSERTAIDFWFVAAKVEMDWQAQQPCSHDSAVLGQSQQPTKEDRGEGE